MREFIANIALSNKKGLKNKIAEYAQSDFFTTDQIAHYQNNKLKNLIEHAYKNVPYYTSIFNKNGLTPKDIQTVQDLQKLPILEKKDIQNNNDALRAKNSNASYSRTTSGSTGKPLTIDFDAENKVVEMALVQRFNDQIGNTAKDTQLLLWGGHASTFKDKIKSFIKQKVYNYKLIDTYSLSNELLEELALKISKGKYPDLRGYTSAVYMLAKKMEEMGLSVNLNSISVSAEQLFDYYRSDIKLCLGNNLYDQYGCGETNSIAFECNRHVGLHHAFEHSILEVVDHQNNPSETGHIVITNLDNYAMPLIRYRNGDLATLNNAECTCGRNSQLIKKIEGRTYDFIKGLNGKIAHGGFFDDVLLESGFTKKYNIKEIRIIQTNVDELTIEYISDDQVTDESKNNVIAMYQKFLGEMKIVFKEVKKMKLTKAGKRKFIISYEEYQKLN